MGTAFARTLLLGESWLTPPDQADRDAALPRWGVRSEEPPLPRGSPAKGHSPISRTGRDAVGVAFGPTYKAQYGVLLEQVVDQVDVEYFRVNFTKGILRLYMTVSLALVLILSQLLRREEEEILKPTYVSISGTDSLPSHHSIVAD